MMHSTSTANTATFNNASIILPFHKAYCRFADMIYRRPEKIPAEIVGAADADQLNWARLCAAT
ncbi:MAG: hypothetical protein WAR76_07660, partial [Xanthobacteraceae bacterium]